jgi:hypothetical protein
MSEWDESLDYAALKAAILTLPGWAQAIADGNDITVAEAMTAVDPAIQITRVSVPLAEVQGAFDDTEYLALSDTEIRRLGLVVQGNAGLTLQQRALIAAVFPQGGPTALALAALATRPGSPTEAP